MDNNVFFKGKAIIDEQFNILSVDDELKDFLGDNLVNTKIARLIHPSDINQLETAVKNAKSESGFVTALRMVDNTGRYRWFVYIIDEAEPADNVCNSRICSISIFDIRVFFKHTDTKADNTYMEYFSLMEYLMFSYDVSTDRLRIFMMESHQQVDFYRGTLADWRRTMLANGNVYGVTRNIFDSFCDDFANGTEIFEREFKMKIFENSQGMEWCLVKGKTIIDFSGKKHVIATMSKISPVNDEEHVYLNSDALDVGTDILNKRAITEYTKRLIESKPGCPVTIAIIDIDNFKTINDEFGHMFGDEVICNVADVIKESVEGKGVAGRIGGDEMFIVVEGLKSNDEIRNVLRTIRNNVSFMYNNQPDKPHVTCSIGSSTYPCDGQTYEELFNIADKMLYLAKEKGRDRYIIYLPDLHEDYVKGKGMPNSEAYMFYKYKKIGVVNDIVNAYRKNGKDCIMESADKIKRAFALDSIFIYHHIGEAWERKIIIGNKDIAEDNDYLNDKAYIADFTEDGIEVIDNINFFERRAKNIVKAFINMGINQAVQIIVNVSDENDVIVSFNRNRQMSKWSEMDIVYLAILGNIFGNGIYND